MLTNITEYVDKELLEKRISFEKQKDGTFIVDLAPFAEVDIKQRKRAKLNHQIEIEENHITYPDGRTINRFLTLNSDDFFMLGLLWGDGTSSTLSREVVDPVNKVYKRTGSPIVDRMELGGPSFENMRRFRDFVAKFSIDSDSLHFTYHYDTRTRINRAEIIERKLTEIFQCKIKFGTYVYSEETSKSPETHGESLTIGVIDSLVSLFIRSVKLITPFIVDLLAKASSEQVAAFLAGMIDAESTRAVGTQISFEQQLITWSEIEGIKFGLGEKTVELIPIFRKKLNCNVRFSFSTNMLGTGYYPAFRMENVFHIYSSKSGLDFQKFIKHRDLVYFDFCEFCKYNSYFRLLFNSLTNKREELIKIFSSSDASIFKRYPTFVNHVKKYYMTYANWSKQSFPSLRESLPKNLGEELQRFLKHLEYVYMKMYKERGCDEGQLPYKEFQRGHTGGSLKLTFTFKNIPCKYLKTIYSYCSEKKAKIGYIYARKMLKEIKNKEIKEKVEKMLSEARKLQKEAISLMKEVKNAPGSLKAQKSYHKFENCWMKIVNLVNSSVSLIE